MSIKMEKLYKLFGEIEDEHDSQVFLEERISEKEFNFSARLEIDYLNEEYNLNIPNHFDISVTSKEHYCLL